MQGSVHTEPCPIDGLTNPRTSAGVVVAPDRCQPHNMGIAALVDPDHAERLKSSPDVLVRARSRLAALKRANCVELLIGQVPWVRHGGHPSEQRAHSEANGDSARVYARAEPPPSLARLGQNRRSTVPPARRTLPPIPRPNLAGNTPSRRAPRRECAGIPRIAISARHCTPLVTAKSPGCRGAFGSAGGRAGA